MSEFGDSSFFNDALLAADMNCSVRENRQSTPNSSAQSELVLSTSAINEEATFSADPNMPSDCS